MDEVPHTPNKTRANDQSSIPPAAASRLNYGREDCRGHYSARCWGNEKTNTSTWYTRQWRMSSKMRAPLAQQSSLKKRRRGSTLQLLPLPMPRLHFPYSPFASPSPSSSRYNRYYNYFYLQVPMILSYNSFLLLLHRRQQKPKQLPACTPPRRRYGPREPVERTQPLQLSRVELTPAARHDSCGGVHASDALEHFHRRGCRHQVDLHSQRKIEKKTPTSKKQENCWRCWRNAGVAHVSGQQ